MQRLSFSTLAACLLLAVTGSQAFPGDPAPLDVNDPRLKRKANEAVNLLINYYGFEQCPQPSCSKSFSRLTEAWQQFVEGTNTTTYVIEAVHYGEGCSALGKQEHIEVEVWYQNWKPSPATVVSCRSHVVTITPETETETETELSLVDSWLKKNGLNEYGDQNGTEYAGGSPLFNEVTKTYVDRLTYFENKFPDNPWSTAGNLRRA